MTDKVDQFSSIYNDVRHGLSHIGYTGNLLQENYQFADVFGPQLFVRSIPLAAFAQEPISYHNACFGVVMANGKSGSPLVEEYRSLGAPQIFEIVPHGIRRWKVTSIGDCELLEDITSEHISSFFADHSDNWSPSRVGEAKFLRRQSITAQLDFFDLGLLPLIDYEVRIKLDKLLTDTISLAVEEYSQRAPFTNQDLPPLFRLIFRLIAAKILNDRSYPGDWISDDVNSIINRVDEFYFKTPHPGLVFTDHLTQALMWERIKRAFHFQNLSVDALAYVYENTLVTKEARQRLAIHGTPPAIAEYIVRNLPFEIIPEQERRVFEPFAGQAAFLVAAMKRMRELISPSLSPQQRHDYFVEHLSGMEIDDFALDVAFQSLMLADYPNPNGWSLYQSDVFKSEILDRELSKANIVLCNPPFEEFSLNEKSLYPNRLSTHKPAEILQRVLKKPPQLLGFVLPRIFISGRGYRNIRQLLANTYSSIEILALPDDVFKYSRMQSILLMASGKRTDKVHLTVGEVPKGHVESFYSTGIPPYQTSRLITVEPDTFAKSIWLRALQEVWDATHNLKTLKGIAEIHRGIEYNISLKKHRDDLISEQEQLGFVNGLHRVSDGLEPFFISGHKYLNISPDLMYVESYKLPWNEPKVIVNAHARQPSGPWKVTAGIDYTGLCCYQSFYGVWATDGTPLEVIAAVLNSPVSNAFIATSEDKRNIRGEAYYAIPFPNISASQKTIISTLVNEYRKIRGQWVEDEIGPVEAHKSCFDILLHIDGEILKAYDLSPKTERTLLDYFAGVIRPGPIRFMQYYPNNFKPYIPWHIYISKEFRDANVETTLERLKPINDSSISKMLSSLEDEPED